ncbi:MAG: sulfite exporter TauE/SafE family protein [Chloroflexi bacterium]|nr:sulfite exporter TauE/SafE family protein [Chloroflexota bacterium]
MTTEFDPLLALLGLFVGTLVGLTGVGGGAILTPLLVLVVGVKPSVAIGTDLAYAALTKMVGGWKHAHGGTTDLSLALRLACGSVPGALLGSWLLTALQASGEDSLRHILGFALILAAGASLLRALGFTWNIGHGETPGWRGAPLLGLGIGVLVGLTSVGAGSLLMAVFALLYRLPAGKAVGTDILHGAVLASVAAMAHGLEGRIDPIMVVTLLTGSVPGVLLGSWLCVRIPTAPLRLAIAGVLAVSGAALI